MNIQRKFYCQVWNLVYVNNLLILTKTSIYKDLPDWFRINILLNNEFNDYYYEFYKNYGKITTWEIIKFSENLKYLLIGNSEGNINIFKIENELQQNFNTINIKEGLFRNLRYIRTLKNHTKEISFIKFNYDLNLLCTCSKDNYINIYTYLKYKLVKSQKIETKNKIVFACLISNPIPSIICYDNEYLMSFPLNKNKIFAKFEISNLKCPILFKNHFLEENLICFYDNKIVAIFDLPDLNLKQEIKYDFEILYIKKCKKRMKSFKVCGKKYTKQIIIEN